MYDCSILDVMNTSFLVEIIILLSCHQKDILLLYYGMILSIIDL